MDDKIFYSSDLENEYDQTGLFDRIINIKFTRKNGETFTLRSDYEAVWSGDTLFFKTCQPKPDIRVQYTQYNAVMINIDIYVTNLNILEDSDNKTAMDQAMINAGVDIVRASQVGGKKTNQPNDTLTMLGNPVINAEIEMGYRGQFYNWGTHVIKNQKADYEAFQNLSRPGTDNSREQVISSQDFFKKHRRCSVVVEWAANISNPPDRVTQFHGYVGSTEAGFQPFSLLAVDCASEAGATGVITKKDIIGGLDDEYYTIDQVPFSEMSKPKHAGYSATAVDKNKNPFQLVSSDNTNTTYRNFFNGGKGFTLLEGYCFHMLTRRFVRSNVNVKRNSKLERAALEYALASSYTNTNLKLSTLKDKFTQDVYKREKEFYKDYFIQNINGTIVLSNEVDPNFKVYLEAQINTALVEQYVGVRFTIKNLPEYRKLYLAIRQKLVAGAAKGEYLSWWDAASELSKTALHETPELNFADQRRVNPNRTVSEINDNLIDIRQYTLDLEQGKNSFQDFFMKNTFSGNDWIVPVQNINSSVNLKDSKGRVIKYKAPTAVNKPASVAEDPMQIPDPPFLGRTADELNAKCFTGLFEVRDAYMFGVPVLCSRKASASFHERHAASVSVTLNFFSTPQAQIEWICRTWDLLYYKLHNGGYYIYAKNESSRDTASQDFVKSQSNKPFKIPAIYDISITPIRKIRMPFMAFLDPMSVVEWNSSAMIGSMISFYFQPNKGRNFFMVVKNAVDFSTASDHNMMELEVVDTEWADKSEVPAKITSDDNKDTFVEVLIFPDSQMDSWRKIYSSPVCSIPFGMLGDWKESSDNESNPALNKVSNKQFFMMLQSWNQTLFDMAKEADTGWSFTNWFSRIDKQANQLYGASRPAKTNFPNIPNCIDDMTNGKLKRIYMKFPILPEGKTYDQMKQFDDKYIMVYESGVWEMRLKESMRDYIIGAQ